MVESYLTLAKKYASATVPLSKEEQQQYSSKRFEDEWQKFVASKGFADKKLSRKDFLQLSLQFSLHLGNL